MRRLVATLFATSLCIAAGSDAVAASKSAAVDAKRLREAQAKEPGQWLSHGRDYSEQRFSPLRRINADNVNQLGLAWYSELDTRRGQESTPIVVDGKMFVTTAWSKLYAFDAKTGEELWKFDPQVPGDWAVNACCDVVNRGAAVWKGKVIYGTIDGRLIALNANNGEVVWQVQATDKNEALSITGAPRIADGRVFIGEAGSEFHQRGYMTAFDAETGKELWRWWVVPGDPSKGFETKELAMAAKTWSGAWWKTGGGGAPWDGITYDPVTDLVYIGTGNGAPWPAEIRSPGGGDNLFISSIVALKAKTGEYVWHYQATPNDSFDFDNTQQIVTADLVIDGVKRHVLMQASKNGLFYVIEGRTGKLLKAKPFVPSVNWMSGLDANGRPILTPEGNYAKTNQGFYVVPSAGGAHSWHPMSFNPRTGLVYIPTNYGSFPLVAEQGAQMLGQKLSISLTKRPQVPPPQIANASYLLAWDPVNMKEVWRQPQGSARAGTMTTAGNLVFQGNAKRQFVAYRADTGEQLWAADTQAGIVAGAVTYTVDNEQYVAIVAGQGGFGNYYAPTYSRVLVYKLGGATKLPEMTPFTPPTLNPPAEFGAPEMRAHGEKIYSHTCAPCHDNPHLFPGMFPDLNYAAALQSADLFKIIVIDGALTPNGMVSFKKQLSVDDAEAIRAYLVSRANEVKRNPPPANAFGRGPGRAPQQPAPATAAPGAATAPQQ